MIIEPIVVYTDHPISKTLCYYFAKGSNSLMANINNFQDFNKIVITYGYLRGSGDLIKKVKNFFILTMVTSSNLIGRLLVIKQK